MKPVPVLRECLAKPPDLSSVPGTNLSEVKSIRDYLWPEEWYPSYCSLWTSREGLRRLLRRLLGLGRKCNRTAILRLSKGQARQKGSRRRLLVANRSDRHSSLRESKRFLGLVSQSG